MFDGYINSKWPFWIANCQSFPEGRSCEKKPMWVKSAIRFLRVRYWTNMYSEAMLVDGIFPLDKPCTARIGWREDPQEPSVTHINVGGKKKTQVPVDWKTLYETCSWAVGLGAEEKVYQEKEGPRALKMLLWIADDMLWYYHNIHMNWGLQSSRESPPTSMIGRHRNSRTVEHCSEDGLM